MLRSETTRVNLVKHYVSRKPPEVSSRVVQVWELFICSGGLKENLYTKTTNLFRTEENDSDEVLSLQKIKSDLPNPLPWSFFVQTKILYPFNCMISKRRGIDNNGGSFHHGTIHCLPEVTTTVRRFIKKMEEKPFSEHPNTDQGRQMFNN